MTLLKIKCPNCSGPMWEEELPDSNAAGKIELVCIICGVRRFFNKRKYLDAKARIEKAIKERTHNR